MSKYNKQGIYGGSLRCPAGARPYLSLSNLGRTLPQSRRRAVYPPADLLTTLAGVTLLQTGARGTVALVVEAEGVGTIADQVDRS